MRTAVPILHELSDAECVAILARNRIGRLAYTFHDRVDVEPIHYVYADGSLYFRTAPGSKANTLTHHPWIAFEVDEADGLLSWRSVISHGTVYHPARTGAPADRAAYDRAVELLRDLIPEVQNGDDPLAFRALVMVMDVDTITGRAARAGDSPR